MNHALSGRVVIHIGAPKTGSTYLQRRLRADPARLREAGIHVPVHPLVMSVAGNAKLLATVLLGEPTLSFARAFPGIDTGVLRAHDVLDALLSDWRRDEEAVILSAENFRPSHAPRLRELLPAGIEPVVVLFVRRQDEWIESYFNQLTKTADIQDDFAAFLDRICDSDCGGERLCRPDWLLHHESWTRAFGECRIVFYEEARDDLLSAFLHAARLPSIRDLPDIGREQVSLDFRQLAYLLELDRGMPFREFRRRRAASGEASRRLGPAQRHSLLSPTDRERLERCFGDSNQRLLAALGRAGDNHLLDLQPEATAFLRLEEFYKTPEYMFYKTSADQIFLSRDEK